MAASISLNSRVNQEYAMDPVHTRVSTLPSFKLLIHIALHEHHAGEYVFDASLHWCGVFAVGQVWFTRG